MDIEGKKAVVFGGTSGIGLATTRKLVLRGATVLAVSRAPSRAGDLPTGVTTASADVLDRDAVENLLASWAPFDILVSSATGGDRALGAFLEMDMDAFEGSFRKVWGYANVVRFGTPCLTDGGAIVLVSGAPAHRKKPGLVAVSAAGAAIEALVRAIAPEIAPRRINVVAPGVIDTALNSQQGREPAIGLTGATAGHLIPRAGTAVEVAQAVVFLIENDFVTGTTIDVDGGWLLA